LKELRIITPGIPYLVTQPFQNLRNIHIVAVSVQLPSYFAFPRLEEFHLTCTTTGANSLTDFLRRHGGLKKVYITLVIPIILTEDFLNLIGDLLWAKMGEELATLIIKDAKEDACGQSQIFLNSVYRQISAKLDEESAKILNDEFATAFRLLKESDEKKHRGTLEEMWSAVQNPDVITFSAEYEEGAHPWI
jgi:hypothetical protein